MKRISIVTFSYNEELNVEPLYEAITSVMAKLPQYDYELIYADNSSKDRTVEILRKIAAKDKRVKVIVNSRNFGHVRSPYHALLQASGDAAIPMACDFQDPPELIPQFIAKWEEGFKKVLAVKSTSSESPAMFAVRGLYYKLINRLSTIELIKNTTGFGLYDKRVIEILRHVDDPYPYFRGLISEIGYETATITFHQPTRRRGITKNNFYTLYDLAMLGITNHSKIPLRIATIMGFFMSGVSLFVSLGYLVAKLLFWNWFTVGTAPLLISLFFFSSVQLFFIGILGEYIGSIHTQVMDRPLVIEKERINFDSNPSDTPNYAPTHLPEPAETA